MFQLIYYSTATEGITKEDIANILNEARAFNTANNITGCLLFHDNIFMQILEGDEEIVRALHGKIEKDKRHTNVNLLVTTATEVRTFKDWSMAYRKLDAANMNEMGNQLFNDKNFSMLEITNHSTHATRVFEYMTNEFLSGSFAA